MASINITEEDFGAVAAAAMSAFDAGRKTTAEQLDKVARKMNAALSNQSLGKARYGTGSKSLTWRDVPSVLEHRL